MISRKYPILIISSPRTGSTALGKTLVEGAIPFFSEPLVCKSRDGRDDRYIKFRNSGNKNFILKVQACQWDDFVKIDTSVRLEDFYKIGLRRKNVVEQIASLYVSLYRGVWVYHSDMNYTQFYNQKIDIIEEKILSSINMILDSNKILESFESQHSIKFDENLYYEDLNLGVDIKTPLPVNYEDIKRKISNIL